MIAPVRGDVAERRERTMANGPSSSNDYWANEFEPGTAAVWTFDGADGRDRVSGPSTVTAGDDFSARIVRIQLDHVAIESFTATPHRAVRGPSEIESHPTPILTFLLLAEGELRVRTPDATYDLLPQQCIVIDSRTPLAYTAERPVRMLRSVVGIEHLPPSLRDRTDAAHEPLERTALVESFIAFVATLLRVTSSGHRPRGSHVIRALADLQSAVLAEARHAAPLDGTAGLAYRMEEYIQAHYAEPDLDPAKVAAAMHISLRHAHGVFDDESRTIARFIADRRVAAVAAELRSSDRPARLSDLAHRHGFSGPDTLTRSFKRRFSQTPSEYRAGGHRHFQ